MTTRAGAALIVVGLTAAAVRADPFPADPPAPVQADPYLVPDPDPPPPPDLVPDPPLPGPAAGGDPDAGVAAAGVDGGPITIDGPDLLGLVRPQASASASPTLLRLGDQLTLFVEVVYDPQIDVNLTASLGLAPAFDELKRSSSDVHRSDGTVKRTYQIRLRVWELGDLTIPPLQVTYTVGGQGSWVVTNPVPIEVQGVLGDVDDKTALLPDTAPRSLSRRDWRWVLGAAGLVGLGLIAAVVVVWWRRRRRRPEVEAPLVALVSTLTRRRRLGGPAERALAALDELERDGLLARDPRAGYQRLVEIAREFFHDQFYVDVEDRTTGELCRALGDTAMPRKALTMTEIWLGRCDLVKFAAERPEPEVSAVDLDRARKLVVAAVTRDTAGPRPPAPEAAA